MVPRAPRDLKLGIVLVVEEARVMNEDQHSPGCSERGNGDFGFISHVLEADSKEKEVTVSCPGEVVRCLGKALM